MAGAYRPSLNRITFNAGLAGEAPGVLASAVALEALHAAAAHGLSAGACIAEEATPFAPEALTWTALPARYRQSDSPRAWFEQRLATVWQQQGLPGLQRLVVSEPVYRAECGLTP